MLHWKYTLWHKNRVQILASSLESIIKRAWKHHISSVRELAGETNFTVIPAAADHIVTEWSSILLKNKSQPLTIKVVDAYGNNIDTNQWDMKMSSSLPVTINGFTSSSSRDFQWKMTSSILNIIPYREWKYSNWYLTSGSTTLKTSLSRPVLSEVKLLPIYQIVILFRCDRM